MKSAGLHAASTSVRRPFITRNTESRPTLTHALRIKMQDADANAAAARRVTTGGIRPECYPIYDMCRWMAFMFPETPLPGLRAPLLWEMGF